MKKLTLFYAILFLGFLAIISSCSDNLSYKDQLQENDMVLDTRGKQVDKPFKGKYTTYPELAGFTPEGYPILEIFGEGNATHVGNSTWIATQINNPAGVEATYVITAGNGDRFWGTYDIYESSMDPETGLRKFKGYMYVDDGDGRFTDATGQFHYYGEATWEIGFFVIDEGTLTY